MKTNYLGLAGVVSHTEANTLEYNRLLAKYKAENMLTFFESWVDGEQLECYLSYVKSREEEDAAIEAAKKVKCVDCDGNEIFVGDTLALMDATNLNSTLYRGRVFMVDKVGGWRVEIHPTSCLDSAKPSDETFTLNAKRFLKIIL